MKQKEWTLYRSKWCRGNGDGISALLVDNPESKQHGLMCCLGQWCVAQGFAPDHIRDISLPSELRYINRELADVFYRPQSQSPGGISPQVRIARTNDRDDITDAQREEMLSAEFAAYGYPVKFVD